MRRADDIVALGGARLLAAMDKPEPAKQILAKLARFDQLDQRQRLMIAALQKQLTAAQPESEEAEAGAVQISAETTLVEVAEGTIDRFAHLQRQV